MPNTGPARTVANPSTCGRTSYAKKRTSSTNSSASRITNRSSPSRSTLRRSESRSGQEAHHRRYRHREDDHPLTPLVPQVLILGGPTILLIHLSTQSVKLGIYGRRLMAQPNKNP